VRKLPDLVSVLAREDRGIAGDKEAMDRLWEELCLEYPDKGQRIALLVGSLDEVGVHQFIQPGWVEFQYSGTVQALIREGHDAIGPLLRCLETDTRLTRSVHFWRNYDWNRNVLGVQDAACEALSAILQVQLFDPDATGDDLSQHGEAGRREVAAAARAAMGKTPAERAAMGKSPEERAAPSPATRKASHARMPPEVRKAIREARAKATAAARAARAAGQPAVPPELLEARQRARKMAAQAAARASRGPQQRALLDAVRTGNMEQAKAELRRHPQWSDARDERGRPAVCMATLYGHTEMVRLLLARGADVSARADEGATALHWAAELAETEILNALLEAGADVNAKDAYACTPLHFAAANGYEDVVEALVAHGARPNEADCMGRTALDYAVGNEEPEVADFLRARGARAGTNAKDAAVP
jgi:hypothetical protein